jgi:hypothetical protein
MECRGGPSEASGAPEGRSYCYGLPYAAPARIAVAQHLPPPLPPSPQLLMTPLRLDAGSPGQDNAGKAHVAYPHMRCLARPQEQCWHNAAHFVPATESPLTICP